MTTQVWKHSSPAKVRLQRNLPVCDDPWPEGLWPLVSRGKDDAGEWLHGATVTIEPARGVLYDTRESIPEGGWQLLRWDVQVRALVPPGEYTVTFEHPDHTVTNHVTVVDPTASLASVEFRDGLPLRIRPGSWDDYIVKEQPYSRLPIPEGAVVMDVGAHIGTFTRDALRRGAGTVIAYEPESVNARLLRENTAGLPVTVVEGALVSDTSPSVLLWMDAGEPGRNALHSITRTRGDRLPVRVPAWNFRDEVWRVRPDVVKVDVEDAEYTYDWELPPEVSSLVVEFGRPHQHKEKLKKVCACLAAQSFTALHPPGAKGWATLGIWTR